MNPLRSWRIGLCLLGIVLATALSGGLIGHHLARRHFDARNNPENWNKRVSLEFDRLVKPTPEQDVRIQAHLDRAVRELQVIRLDTIARSTNVIGRLIADVEKELTPEQRQAFEAMKPKPADLTLDVLNVESKPGRKP
jgi:capsid protein